MPRSIRFFFRDRWKDGTVSSSSEDVDPDGVILYEPANTQVTELSGLWQSESGDVTAAYLSNDLGGAYRIGAVCIVRTNLTENATIRVRVGNTFNFSTNLYDSGVVQRDRYFSNAEITAARTSEFFLNGLPLPNTQLRIQRQVHAFILPSEVTAQYVRVDFSDAGNPDGRIQVGYVYAGIVYEPSNDLLFGWQLQRDNVVRGGQAASGQYWSADVFHKTLVSFALAPQSESTVLNIWMLFEHLINTNQIFLMQLVDFTDSLRFTTTLYCRMVNPVANRKIAFNSYGLIFSAEEVID